MFGIVVFIKNSGIEKTFLFDVSSKTYIATDSSPVDMQSYELCSDMIDVVLDMTEIYDVESGMESRVKVAGPDRMERINEESRLESIGRVDKGTIRKDPEEKNLFSVVSLDNGMILYLCSVNR
jgi:Ras-related GTP-binding protein C/D